MQNIDIYVNEGKKADMLQIFLQLFYKFKILKI